MNREANTKRRIAATYKAKDFPPDDERIGMCCNCGGTFSKTKTILVKRGYELCQRCAEDLGMDE